MKKAIALILVAFITLGVSSAQTTSWKNSRHSIYWGIGGNLFQGDLSPAEKDHAVNFKTLGGSAQFGYKFKLSERFSLRANLMYSLLHAYDSEGKKDWAKARALNFRSNTWALEGILDFYLIKEKEFTALATPTFGQRWALYIFGGVGGFWFNPEGSYNDVWYRLQPLQTEGEEYKRIAAEFPFGLGIKYQLGPKVALGGEIALHPTTTDYLDDVHDKYAYTNADAAKAQINQYKTPNGEAVSPMNYLLGDKGKANAVGSQRGGADYNDWYVTAMLTLSYKFTASGKKHVAKPKYQN